MAADGQEHHGGHPGAVGGTAEDRNPIVDSLVQLMWLLMARNTMVDTLMQFELLQLARNPVVDTQMESF